VHKSTISETLLTNDLEYLVDNIIEIDSFSSKMGEDRDIVVLSFTVESLQPAKDLVEFIEKGYDFVLDADSTPGELNDGRYRVFVEIERNRKISKQILEILEGVKNLTGIDNFKFRYYKSFRSNPVDEETLNSAIPKSKEEYDTAIKSKQLENFSNFFGRSFVESIGFNKDTLIFNKAWAGSLKFKVIDSGSKAEVYNNLPGAIMLESKDVSEILFLTKYIGNYNITKVHNCFVFESNGYAVALERI
jgi:hypothetical protein